jgi:hypothetical protein
VTPNSPPGHNDLQHDERSRRAGLFWQATLEYGPFAIAAILLLLSSLADVLPSVERFFPASRVGVYVCITFIALFAFVIRLSERVSTLTRAVHEGVRSHQALMSSTSPAILQMPLGQAFRMAESLVGRTEHIRIFAVTSRFISAHMQPREFSTSRLDLMVVGADPKADPMLDTEVRLSVLYTWAGRVRAGAIGRLIVRQYNFYPMEWFVIFDNRLMITSTYMYEAAQIGKTRTVPEAFIVLPHGEGGSLIDAKVETFDALFAAAETDFGTGEYEGDYELRDGVVMRCRGAGIDWEILSPVSQGAIA